MTRISRRAVVQVSEQQISTELPGEAVILDPVRGNYYTLEGVGAEVWRLLQEPRTLPELEQAVMARYEVEVEHCRRDLQELLLKLSDMGLVEIREA